MRLAIGLLGIAAFAQDPPAALEAARDKVLAATSHLPTYVCTETVDRSYYLRKNDTPSSCEKIALDRKRGQDRVQLEKTDRLRVAVAISQGHEIYSWTGVAPHAHGVEDILNGGPIGTGPFAAHLLDIFTNSAARFRLLSEPADRLDFGFRVPLDASHYVVYGGGKWLPTGYGGSLRIGGDSLDILRLELETDALPPETGICEERTVLEFLEANGLPSESRAHLIMRDGTETDRVTTISDCREASTLPPPTSVPQGEPVPKGLRFDLRLDSAIDSDLAAAGDAISATTDAGAKVTGRIVQMAHSGPTFFISVAFDTLDQKGVLSPFYA